MNSSYNRSPQLPINFFSEDFIAGFQPRNRMSVVRRFFCLFVTFDLVFVALLWLICIAINGENILEAMKNQIVNYSIESSLFDVVATSAARFVILIFFYAILQINHWIIIAFTTTLSCSFLITKVFFYSWPSTQQPVFQVLLIIISFVISWFEAWFLDSRMIPQEDYSRSLAQALNASNAHDTTPLLAPFLNSVYHGTFHPAESYRQSFYSPVNSVLNYSDDEDEEFKQLGTETVMRAFELLESPAWKVEKKLSGDDVIYTMTKNIGKVYKLRGKVNYPPKKLLYELYYKIEEVPTWNPTLLESRVIKKINDFTDISYSVSQSGGGGIVKSRDFVNLRCWRLMNDARVIEDYDIRNSLTNLSKNKAKNALKKSASDAALNGNQENCQENGNLNQLSKSFDAADINGVTSDEEEFSDAQQEVHKGLDHSKSVFVNAAMSVDYAHCPPTSKYIRGDNIMSCWAMRPVEGDEDSSIFEWLLCIDLKGSLPKYVLNTAFTTLMTDYLSHLRNHIKNLNEQDANENENDDQ